MTGKPACLLSPILLFAAWMVALAGAQPGPADGEPASPPRPKRAAPMILEGAKQQAARRTLYYEEYRVLEYPGGDVPADRGVCTDLVIRAFRTAGVDLQKELHEDRVARPEVYPLEIWENKKPDKNIDHRRCQNLVVWFRRHSMSLTTKTDAQHLSQWQPGDVVFYVRKGASHPWHVAIIGDKKDSDGMPMIIDAYPPWTSQSHRLDTWSPIHSHFRYENPEGNDKASARDLQNAQTENAHAERP